MISEVLHLLVELTPENRRRSFTQYFIKLSYANFIKYHPSIFCFSETKSSSTSLHL